MNDTIAAIATAAGIGGVGIVRVSGPRAIEIVAAITGVVGLDRRVRVATATRTDGGVLDQVIAFAMRGPRSFTGEDVAELHGHGGTHNLAALLHEVVVRGARVAEPGEFTRRAVEHGKLDLLRAEALLGVIHAGSERALRMAQATLGGRLGDEVRAIETRGLRLLAEIEGRIDFPDEDLEPASVAWIGEEVMALATACARLADSFRHGRVVERGVTVALVGAVNVGKSSLLNALIGSERAIVDPAPGTTRDYLEVATSWDGIAVTLVDTAGVRETGDAIERRGIELGEARVATAEVVVVVNDGVATWDDGARFGARLVLVRNKADVTTTVPEDAGLATSAVTGAGLVELRQRVLAVAGVADREGSEQAFVTTARQHEVTTRAAVAFAAAREAWISKFVIDEVVALEVRAGTQALAQLRGVEVGERVLDEVFARFCIGK
ncbi:MAG: tRNA uridine-5-carboxymethylaminomethyl(34) synthesis GTPase MnmE [Proteobacteria bacterium]|nr:tRNA uridine-5-carboxymethylaminomethyl(34) synthesis GTPase MnmE [Pseudomonadota bacterium]